jgi:CRISPR-associated endonuclease/helicase Cas3
MVAPGTRQLTLGGLRKCRSGMLPFPAHECRKLVNDMTRTTKRSTRLNELEELLAVRKRMAIGEIVAHFQNGWDGKPINRSTVYRMLDDLETESEVPLIRERGVVSIDTDRYLAKLKLNIHEAMAVYLAARLLARYSDKPNPHAVSALDKISLALRKIAPRIADHIAVTSRKLDRPPNERGIEHLRALEALTRAWVDGVRVRIVQRSAPDAERLFEPYFIEPSAVGYSSYVIGYDHLRNALRTFKIEHLLRVTPTADTYTIPATFDPLAKLAGAWGVNWGSGDPVEVVLRYPAKRTADRVRDTNWHETQVIEDLPDGGCILRIRVGSTQEMKPWIRQWGPDVEVLAPAELRKEIGDEMRRAGELYQVSLQAKELDKGV